VQPDIDNPVPPPTAVSTSGGPAALLRGSMVWLRDVGVAGIVSLFIILFLYQPVRVEGTSMVPELQDQDRLCINKLAYRVGSIQRGDVVVFQYPRDPSRSYIKRVIGLPGDTIRIAHGRVFLNGVEQTEGYVPARYADERSEPEEVVPAGDFFVMGDHRSVSYDSRDFGPVERHYIYGKAAFVYWPFSEAGVVR
jgi:signal peptidase I